MTNLTAPISNLAFIEVQDESNPFTLFKQWKEQLERKPNDWLRNVFCLATSPLNGQPSNRNVVLKEIDDGFIFTTDKGGRKYNNIVENPHVAATFLWDYNNETHRVVQQVRIEGTICLVDEEKCQQLYNEEPGYCKIRAHLCHQGQEVQWEEQKRRHDELVKKYLDDKSSLPKPDHYVALKIIPNRMEFYYCAANGIADRIVFTKTEDTWEYIRIAP